jgi:acyl-[acyl-carrier-protein]-phospholipid O-acyltransferase / long-chain-fatty-acid--[acyl-carrier-protein] ligase
MDIPSHSDSAALDALDRLPPANRRSTFLVLLVQALNSFNDNFVKMLLVALAMTVAKDSDLGKNMQSYLVVVFSLPFIVFAPVAGWLSDRYSKKQVIVWMQAVQLLCFAAVGAALMLRDEYWSLVAGLGAFFLLAIQATFFSPAKLGIMKEIVGTRRLGPIGGLLQMTMLACVLLGFWAGGTAFESLLAGAGPVAEWTKAQPWNIGLGLIVAVTLLGVGQLMVSGLIQATPAHPEVAYSNAVWTEHLPQLRLLFRDRPVRLAGLGITYFWFVSNAVGIIVATLAADMGRGPAEVGKLAALLGVGVMIGSVVAGMICKRRVELGLIPVAGLGMVAGLLMTGLAPLGSLWMYGGLVLTGLMGGCFMVPLYAFIQDRARPEERARVMAGVNLMDCIATIAVAGIIIGLAKLGLNGSQQLLCFAAPTLVASIFMTRILPQQFVRFVCQALIRTIYKVKSVNAANLPSSGGVLLLPNHVSYVDALVLGAAFERPVRFVMWDTLYKVWWMNGFLRLFGTVPISPTRAKDAIRTVVEALKAGEAVCLFPEGQITRLGLINEIRKGFELMARQANVPVLPIYHDGLWGSIASHEGAGCFKKLPKRLRYPVSIHYGKLLSPKEAKSEVVRDALLQLSSEAWLGRNMALGLTELNAMRLAEVTTHDASDRVVDDSTGAVYAVRLANPIMPTGEEGQQLGQRAGSVGRLLPGLAAYNEPAGLRITGLAPGDLRQIFLPNMGLDSAGFICPVESSAVDLPE